MPTSPLFRTSTALAPPATPYGRFGFKWNPFPEKPGVLPESDDPRTNGSIYVEQARIHEQRRFEELLAPRADRSARPMAFLMDAAQRKGRGIGKTAFLNHQRRRIMADFGETFTAGAHVLFTVHLFTPADGNSRKSWQFARALIEALNDQDVLANMLWRLRAFSGLVQDELLEQTGEPSETIGDNQWLMRHDVDVDNELTPAIKKKLVDAGVDEPLAESLAKSGHNAGRFRHDFLRHQSDYRWRLNAVRWLTSDLVSCLQAAKFTRGLFLIDDFERCVLEQNSRERRTFIDSIRYAFLDGPTLAASNNFYSFLWVIHPYIQELLVGDWNAAGMERFCSLSGERAGTYTLDFLPLTREATEQVVMGYLDEARLDPSQRGSLQPFNAEAIDESFMINAGLPGFVLEQLHLAVERAIRGNWSSIDAARIRELAPTERATSTDTNVPGPLVPADVDLQAGQGE
jgi:hypothetical protein